MPSSALGGGFGVPHSPSQGCGLFLVLCQAVPGSLLPQPGDSEGVWGRSAVLAGTLLLCQPQLRAQVSLH